MTASASASISAHRSGANRVSCAPAVVATADGVLQAEPRAVHVVRLTSNTGRSLLTEVVVTHDDVESAAQVHLLTPISVQRIVGQPSDNVGALALAQLRSIVADLFDTP